MRNTALAAAAVCIGMSLATTASARVWNDDAGRISFDAPSSWVMDQERSNPETIVTAGNADNECIVFAVPNANTAGVEPNRVRTSTQTPISAAAWEGIANVVSRMFPNRNASVASSRVDNSGPWPIQRAELLGGTRAVTAAMQARPGVDFTAFCWTYDGPDATATYEAFFRSLSHPNDTTWNAELSTPQLAPTPTAPAQPQ